MAGEIEKRICIDRKEPGVLHKGIMVLLLKRGSIFLLSTPVFIYILFVLAFPF